MSNLLVHLHLFYTNQADYFIEKLSHVNSCRWDLIITLSKNDPETEAKISMAYPNAIFMITENRGYDIWPFLHVINTINIRNYDFVLKLHSKNSNPKSDGINGISYKNYELRDALVDSYLKDDKQFLHVLRYMEEHPQTGMYCNQAFYKQVSEGLPEDLDLLKNEMVALGLSVNDWHFCAGSMFFARTGPYEFLKKKNIGPNKFPDGGKSHTIGTMAHVYERIISFVVTALGLSIDRFSTSFLQKLYLDIVIGFIQPIAERIFAIKRIGNNRVKTLVLFGIKIPLE